MNASTFPRTHLKIKRDPAVRVTQLIVNHREEVTSIIDSNDLIVHSFHLHFSSRECTLLLSRLNRCNTLRNL